MRISQTAKWLGPIVIVMATAVLTACSQGFSPPKASPPTSSPATPGVAIGQPVNGLVQANSEGSVTVEVKWVGDRNGSLTFVVSMDTHSVNLDKIDLGAQAVLRDDTGEEYRPVSWRSAPGGHHRSGTLTLPVPSSVSQLKYLELVISNVAGVKERVLRWQLS